MLFNTLCAFESVDEILKCDHSNESRLIRAFLWCLFILLCAHGNRGSCFGKYSQSFEVFFLFFPNNLSSTCSTWHVIIETNISKFSIRTRNSRRRAAVDVPLKFLFIPFLFRDNIYRVQNLPSLFTLRLLQTPFHGKIFKKWFWTNFKHVKMVLVIASWGWWISERNSGF